MRIDLAKTEQFLRSDFVTSKPGPESKLVPGKRQVSVEEFFCPCCGIENPPPKHGVHAKCVRCDAHWISHGNAFNLWK